MSVARDEFDRLATEYDLDGWRLEVSARMTSYAGWCYHRSKTIRIAEWLVLRASDAEIRDTVRHEVAHALAGAKAQHGPAWKALAIELGAKPSAEYDYALLPLTARARPRRRTA